MRQTAVEWLLEDLLNRDWYHLPESIKNEIIEQAKEMEKKQIMDATYYGHLKGWVDDGVENSYGEEYYNEEEIEYLIREIILADIIGYRMRGLKENGSYARESPSFRSALYTIYSKLSIEDLKTIHELKVLYYERSTERRKN